MRFLFTHPLIPIKFNSHKMSPTERNLSQYEAEALALVFCVSKESDILAFGNLTLYTDCHKPVRKQLLELSRWDILLRSYNMEIVFLPNTHGIIKICDLLTRNEHKGGQPNKKLKRVDLETFDQFNFEGLAPMAIQDCMQLIDDINKLAEKTNLYTTKLAHINVVFWCPPVLPIHMESHPLEATFTAGCTLQCNFRLRHPSSITDLVKP